MQRFLALLFIALAGIVSAQVIIPWEDVTKPVSISSVGNLTPAANRILYYVDGTTAGLLTVGGNLSLSGGVLNLSATPNIGAATGTSLALTGNLAASGGQFTGSANTTSSGGLGLKFGLIGGAISNATDAFIGVHNTGGLGLAAGDLLYVTRTTSGGGFAHRFFVENAGAATERFTIGLNGISTSGNLTVSGTGVHAFAGDVRATGGTDPASGTASAQLHVQAGNPKVSLVRAASTVNQRIFDMIGQADGVTRFRYVNDASSAAASQISITGNSTSAISTEIHGNLTVSGAGTHALAGRVNTTINAGGNGFISTLRNSGGNGILELVGTSAGPAEKAAQFFADGTGNFTLYTNATPGTLGTAALTVAPAGNISLLGVTAFKGTTANDNAATGYAGEFLNATVGSGGAYSLTSGTVYSVTSVGLTPGDWDLEGSAVFTQAGGTTATDYIVGITNSLSAWDGGETSYARTGFLTSAATTLTGTMPAVKRRVSTSSSITYYLLVRGTFTGGTLTVYGNINARRVR